MVPDAGGDQTVGTTVWEGYVSRSLDAPREQPRSGRGAGHGGRQAFGQAAERGRGAFSGAHGSRAPARSDDLRGRPDDQSGAGAEPGPALRGTEPGAGGSEDRGGG